MQEQVLDLHPVHKSIQEAPKLDVVTTGVLEKKGRTNTVAKDNSLKKIHAKIRDAFGPFARMWQMIDDATQGDVSRPVKLPLSTMKTMCEQTSFLLGQAANSVSYLRRKSLLSNITSEKTSKTLLTTHKDLFEKEDPYNEIIPENSETNIDLFQPQILFHVHGC